MHLSRALKQSAVAVLAAALLASGSGAFAGSGESGWRPGDDDVLLLQIRVGKFKLLNDVRGYQTPGGACVDLADVIQSLDLPIRLDRKSRRATSPGNGPFRFRRLPASRNALSCLAHPGGGRQHPLRVSGPRAWQRAIDLQI